MGGRGDSGVGRVRTAPAKELILLRATLINACRFGPQSQASHTLGEGSTLQRATAAHRVCNQSREMPQHPGSSSSALVSWHGDRDRTRSLRAACTPLMKAVPQFLQVQT